MHRLVYIATHPITAFRLMDGQLGFMRQHGFDVTVITSPGALLQQAAEREGVEAVGVPMTREVSPLADAVALARLTRELRRLRPTIVNAGTPKAGLLGVMAARLARVPIVVYLLRGLRFESTQGAKRLVLVAAEHVVGSLADRVFANSNSLRERYAALGCAPRDKVWVPASGSSNGIDFERFVPTSERRTWGKLKREELGFAGDAFVVGFVGRLARDKGIEGLFEAFQRASITEPRLRLLLVGEPDASDPLPAEMIAALHRDRRVVVTGFVEEPAAYYSLLDLLAFPSRREGFPNAPLEAAAAERPVVAFRAVGTVDAVIDGRTGTLLEPGDVAGLAAAFVRYARDPALCRAQGGQARAWVQASFRRERIWQALLGEYQRLIALQPALLRRSEVA